MKRLFCTLFIALNVCAIGSKAQTADSLGLPGDNLDLSGVLELFKKTENPEEFEKKLNSSETKLNNLDLNGDGETDYIRVIDRTEKNLHALVLQIPVNEDESQDVAVIEIEKKDDGTAHLQIVGDEELYGKNYIIEPKDEASKTATAATPSSSTQTQQSTTPAASEKAANNPPPPVVVNVWGWPSVRYIYGPAYNPWVSPWRWRYYPPYWRPWRPVFWSAYHPHWHPHWAHYHRVHTHRIVPAHDMYYGHRTVSRTVYQKRSAAPGAAPAVQPRTRRAPEHRAPHRQRVEKRQPRNSAPRSSGQPRQQTKPRGGRTSGSTGPRR